MQIKINLNQASAATSKASRTNFYIWKNLNHLTDYYSDVVSPDQISEIANSIRSGKYLINQRKFEYRKELSEQVNERGLCNLVEIEILNNSNALSRFLEKPLVK